MISYTNVIIFKTIAVYQKPVEKILELLPLIEPLEWLTFGMFIT